MLNLTFFTREIKKKKWPYGFREKLEQFTPKINNVKKENYKGYGVEYNAFLFFFYFVIVLKYFLS